MGSSTAASLAKVTLLATLTGVACEPPVSLDNTPSLEWEKAEARVLGDTADNRRVIDITMAFTDGDGDVGSADEDIRDTCDLNQYDQFLERYDLYIYYHEKVNGQLKEIPPADSCLPFHNILPNLTPEGQNKTLEGTIKTPFEYSNFPVNRGVDSIMFELRLEDRAGRSSPRISGPVIAVP